MTTLSRITLVSALLALLPAVAPAADKVTRTRMLASDGINAILIQARVGSVRPEPGEGNAIEAKVTLEAKRNSDPVSDLPDVTKVQMSATTRGAVTKPVGAASAIVPVASIVPVRKPTLDTCPSPVARRLRMNRRVPGGRPACSGCQTIDGLKRAALSRAYSCVK